MSFDPDKPFQTRDGREARLIAKDVPQSNGETLVVLVTNQDESKYVTTRFPDGRYFNSCAQRPDDLINVPQKDGSTINHLFAVVSIDFEGNETLLGYPFGGPILFFTEGMKMDFITSLPDIANKFGNEIQLREYTQSQIVCTAHPKKEKGD